MQSDPRWQKAPLDQVEVAKDAAQSGLRYLLQLQSVQVWRKEDLFYVARNNMIWFLQNERDKALRRKEVPYPDEEPSREPQGDDDVTRGTPWPRLLDAQVQVSDSNAPDSAEQRGAMCTELLEEIAIFLTQHTRMSEETKADIWTYIKRCCDGCDHKELVEELGWTKKRVRKTRAKIMSYRKHLLVWLKERGYGDLLDDVLGSD